MGASAMASKAWPAATRQERPDVLVTTMVQVPVSVEANTSTTELFEPKPMDWRLSPYREPSRSTTASRGAQLAFGADCAGAMDDVAMTAPTPSDSARNKCFICIPFLLSTPRWPASMLAVGAQPVGCLGVGCYLGSVACSDWPSFLPTDKACH